MSARASHSAGLALMLSRKGEELDTRQQFVEPVRADALDGMLVVWAAVPFCCPNPAELWPLLPNRRARGRRESPANLLFSRRFGGPPRSHGKEGVIGSSSMLGSKLPVNRRS